MTVRSCLFLILLVQAINFGPSVFTDGFYHDDWTVLELAGQGVKAFADSGQLVRPVGCLLFPGLYKAFGIEPIGWHLVNFCLEGLAMCLAFLALGGRDEKIRLPVLCATLIVTAWPNHAVTHHWISSLPQNLALVLTLSSILAKGWPAKLGLYALSLASYEAFAFFPLAGLVWRRWDRLYYLPVMGAYAIWASRFSQRPPGFSIDHAFRVLTEGIRALI